MIDISVSIIYFLFIFVLGAIIGSFLNVVVDRGNLNKTVISGRSHCDYCKKPLSALDLIPLLSYLLLKGKCRYCGHKLSFYYPLTEIKTGVVFVVALVSIGSIGSMNSLFHLFYYLLINSVLIVIFFTDLKYGIIPFKTVLIGLVTSFLWHVFFPTEGLPLLNYFLSGTGASLFFLSLFLVTRGKGMGFGDVVYVFLMGFVLGYPKIILGLYIAVISGALISLVVLAIKKKKIRGATIPFGPFLVAGTVISLFWGDFLIRAALSYLLR